VSNNLSSPAVVFNNPSEDQITKAVVYQEPPSYESLFNNINTSNTIQYQSQIGSRNNAASTQLFINPQFSQTSSIDNIETYRIWSILNILFCFSCVGCIACWYSTETERLKGEGNIQAALKASETTRNLNIIGTICGIILIILFVFFSRFSHILNLLILINSLAYFIHLK
jgi:hypothetical protein